MNKQKWEENKSLDVRVRYATDANGHEIKFDGVNRDKRRERKTPMLNGRTSYRKTGRGFYLFPTKPNPFKLLYKRRTANKIARRQRKLNAL